MARGRVYSEVIVLEERGYKRSIRRWGFSVLAFNGVVLNDNGYGSQQTAITEASRLVRAVELIEGRGHRLRSWRSLVDEAEEA